MALLLLENFEHLDAPVDKYDVDNVSFCTISTTYAMSGTRSLRQSGEFWTKFPISDTDVVTGVVGWGLYLNRAPETSIWVFLLNSSSGNQLMLYLHRNGILEMRRTASTSTHIMFAASKIRIDTWHYIEVKWNCVNSIGANTCQVRVDGETIMNVPEGTDCQGSAVSGAVNCYLQSPTMYGYFDNVYICDLTGPQNNDFLGPIVIETLYPDSSGTTNDFIGSDADSVDNHLLVDDAQPDDDSTYTESSTVTDVDLYGFDALAGSPDTIIGVSVDCYCRMDDAGPKSGKIITHVNGSTYEGGTFSLTTGFLYETELWGLNPDDSAAWEVADIAGAEFGVKVEA